MKPLLALPQTIHPAGGKLLRPLPLLLAGVLLLSATFSASAKDCAGVTFPDRVQVSGTPLVLNGLGIRKATLLKIKVYVAALYLKNPSANASAIIGADQPKRLVLSFLRDVDRDDIVNAWNEGFEANGGNGLPGLKDRITTLNGWMANVEKGQQLTFTYSPGLGLEVLVAGQAKGKIPGEDFAKAFFAIWLGANPPNWELKTGLLGGGCG